jgi:hypothetical protein
MLREFHRRRKVNKCREEVTATHEEERAEHGAGGVGVRGREEVSDRHVEPEWSLDIQRKVSSTDEKDRVIAVGCQTQVEEQKAQGTPDLHSLPEQG